MTASDPVTMTASEPITALPAIVTSEPPEPLTCADKPCLHGGTCISASITGGRDGYSCSCSFQYSGQRCETGIAHEITPMAFQTRAQHGPLN